MNRRWRWMIGVPALMSAAILFAAGISAAKGPGGGGHGGGGHGGGGHGGGGHSGGGGGRSSGGGGGGRSFSAPSRSIGPSMSAPSRVGPSRVGPSTGSPAVAGRSATGTWDRHGNWDGRHFDHDGHHHHHHHSFFFFGYPYYDPWFWGYGYPYPYFYRSFPSWYYWSNYAYDRGPVYVYNTDDGGLSAQQDPPAPPADLPKLDDNAVLIGIRVPENAEIWFDGEKTSQKGTLREFVTPPLDPGQKFTYEIKARWTENGKEVIRLRKQEVYAGDRLLVNMLTPEKKSSAPKP